MEGVQNSASHKVSILEETAIIITINQPCFTQGGEGLGLKVGEDNLACPRSHRQEAAV